MTNHTIKDIEDAANEVNELINAVEAENNAPYANSIPPDGIRFDQQKALDLINASDPQIIIYFNILHHLLEEERSRNIYLEETVEKLRDNIDDLIETADDVEEAADEEVVEETTIIDITPKK